MGFTGDELNFLVYRYLQESGFKHSAFVFGLESHLPKSNIKSTLVPPGALISIVQKGLYYTEAETCVGEDGSEHSLSGSLSLIDAVMPEMLTSQNKQKQCMDKFDSKETDDVAIAKKMNEKNASIEVTVENLTILKGHKAEAFNCMWHPTVDKLASGSGDNTARIWDMTNSSGSPSHLVLKHTTKENKAGVYNNQDVTTLQWNNDGSLLATGSYDGFARVWTQEGVLLSYLGQHRGAIFALKWNKSGNYILTAGVDGTTIVWNADLHQCYRQFSSHTAPVLDINWKTNTCFASCGTDKLIHVHNINDNQPIKSFRGHTNEINTIEWDPQSNLLASCSDDMTVKLWSINQDTFVKDLLGHNGEIYTIKWSPTGPGTNYPNMDVTLASASFDSTVHLWNVEIGVPLHILMKHVGHIYSVAFSPDGKYLASGSLDKCVYIWSSQSGELIRSFKGTGGIYEVNWNCRGDKVSASADDGNVFVIDLRSL